MEDFKQYYKFPLKPMEGLELVKGTTDPALYFTYRLPSSFVK